MNIRTDEHYLSILCCNKGGRRMFWDRIIHDKISIQYTSNTADYVRITSTSKWQSLRLKLVNGAVLAKFLPSRCHHFYIQRIQRFTMAWVSLSRTATRYSINFSAYLERVLQLVTKQNYVLCYPLEQISNHNAWCLHFEVSRHTLTPTARW